jgi:hypothetical protein
MSLAVVRDMRETRAPAGAEEAAALETDVLTSIGTRSLIFPLVARMPRDILSSACWTVIS